MSTFLYKPLIALLVLAALLHPALSAQSLFPVYQNDCYGYIDSLGTMVIPPIFLNAGEFNDGLAPARIEGRFGYIDSQGDWAIPPQYDYAVPFSNGYAIVFVNGKPFFIDVQGTLVLKSSYSDLTTFKQKRAIVSGPNKKLGVIDLNGKLLIDTIYDFIDELKRGYFLLRNEAPDSVRASYIMGLVDSTGRFIVPMGKYRDIEMCGEDYLKLQLIERNGDQEVYTNHIIDYKGNTLFNKTWPSNQWINGPFNCGLASIHLYRHDKAGNRGYRSTYGYYGYVNLKGELVINDSSFQSVTEFGSNRAFVQKEDRNYYMINTKGETVGSLVFDYVHKFENGVAEVRAEDGKWGVVDTNAHWVIYPNFSSLGRLGDTLFYFRRAKDFTNEKCEGCYGICTYDGKVIVKPVLENLDRNGFHNGLLRCQIADKLSFINLKGALIWQQKKEKKKIHPLNIDYMNRGYFYTFSEPIDDYNTGHGTSGNGFKKLKSSAFKGAQELFLIVNREDTDTIYSKYKAHLVTLGNRSNDTIWFEAQDSRLYMKVQAKENDGEWHDIEYLPSSWCGNSYHEVYLAPKSYWEFYTPCYTGDLPVKLRVELVYIDPSGAGEINEHGYKIPNSLTLYSNEYTGSINPAQFWRKPGYSPQNIMDPYFD